MSTLRRVSVITADPAKRGRVVTPPAASDPTPAVTLRELLAGDRKFGLAFTDVFSLRVEQVTNAVSDQRERAGWRGVLCGQRAAWRAGFEREDAGAAMRLTAEMVPGD